jgi:hypothetical protein
MGRLSSPHNDQRLRTAIREDRLYVGRGFPYLTYPFYSLFSTRKESPELRGIPFPQVESIGHSRQKISDKRCGIGQTCAAKRIYPIAQTDGTPP